jgi:Protein of unknown function (DUF732)
MSKVALGIAAVALAAAAAMGSGQAHASPLCKPPQCGGPYPVGWLCDETDYLAKLGRDGVTVHDQAAAVNVGYRVCRDYIGPSDEDTPNLGAKEQQAARMVSASGVFAPSDAQQVVSDAVIELC